MVRESTFPVSRKLFVFRGVPANADEAAGRWTANQASAIGSDSALPIASCTVNSAQSSHADSSINQIDEIGLPPGADIKGLLDLYTAVARKEYGDLSFQMLMTEPKVFKGT